LSKASAALVSADKLASKMFRANLRIRPSTALPPSSSHAGFAATTNRTSGRD
jgi:hypothetical protein